MADLGNLFFSLGLIDKTDKDLEKILKKISDTKAKLDIEIDGAVAEKVAKAISESNKGAEKSSKAVGDSVSKNLDASKELTKEAEKRNKEEWTIFNNTEKILRATERLNELERSVFLRKREGTEEGRKVLSFIERTRKELAGIDVSNTKSVAGSVGARLSAEVNIRKDIIRVQTRSMAESEKEIRAKINGTDRVERALLRLQGIQNRITDDPFRNKVGYKDVLADIDKMKLKLESLKTSSGADMYKATGTSLSKYVQGLERAIKKQDTLYRDTSKQTNQMTRVWDQMGNKLKTAFSIYTIQRFTRQLIEMGGEFEKQHYALRAIIGDMGKADQIFNNLRKVAVKSPFHFGDFTGYAKQLAAFAIPVNEIYDTTKRLSDVSAGLGVDMGRIILAYGQIRAASFLRGQEVRQLTEAGIPIIEALADKFGELEDRVVSANEVFDKISRREVPFAMVKDVFNDLTDEGGKFYKMQERLAESLSGKWANITSNYQLMLYDTAQDNRGVLSSMLDIITLLIQNYGYVQKALLGLISTYVAYNTVMTIANAKQSGAIFNLSKWVKNLNATQLAVMAVTTVVGLLVTSISMAGESARKQREEIEKIIKAHNDVLVSTTNHLDKLVELADKESSGIDVTNERIAVLKQLEHIEPKVADEVRKHADSIAWLTEVTQKYNSINNIARDLDVMMKAGGSSDKTIDESLEKVETLKNSVKSTMASVSADVARAKTAIKMYDDGDSGWFKVFQMYEKDIPKVKKILSETNDELDAMSRIRGVSSEGVLGYSNVRDYAKEIEDLNKELAVASKESSTLMDGFINTLNEKIEISGFEQGTEEYIDVLKGVLSASQEITGDMKKSIFKTLVPVIPEDEGSKSIDSWQDYIDEFLDGLYKVSSSASQIDVIGDLEKEYNTAKSYIEKLNKEGLTKVPESQKGEWLVAKGALENFKFYTEAIEKYRQALIALGVSEDKIGKKEKDSGKDLFAESMEKRVKLIQDAVANYEKYIPLLGKAEALSKTRSDARFTGLDFDPDKVRQSLQVIYDKLGDTDAQKKVKESIQKLFTDYDFNAVKKGVDSLANDISKYINESKDRWGLFDKLFEQTGDRDYAMRFAFGTDDDSGIDNYLDALKSKLSELMDDDEIVKSMGMDAKELEEAYGKPIADLFERIKESKKKTNDDIKLSDAKAIAETMSMEEQANAIRTKYTEKMDATDNEKAKLAYQQLMNKELADLYSKAIQLSPVWKALFGDVSDYSYNMLKKMVKEAEDLAKTAVEVKDSSGKSTGITEMTDKDGNKLRSSTEQYTRFLKSTAQKSEELKKSNPFGAFYDSWSKFLKAPKGEDREKALQGLVKTGAQAAFEVGNIAAAFSEMFDSLGNEGLADTIGLVGDLSNGIGNIAAGFTQGGAVGGAMAMLTAIPSMIGSIAKTHDKKLDRKIQKSAMEVKRLQDAYEGVAKVVERQLGAMTKKQADEQINSLKRQQDELRNMIKLEQGKKKSDQGKIYDYKKQIKDLQDQIQYFYEDLAKALYDIDIKGWASQFSTAMMDAWRKGADGALAYEKVANDVLASVANKMIAETVIEPALRSLREQLPSMLEDGQLSKDDIAKIADSLVEVGGKYEKAIDDLEKINEAIKEASGGKFDLKQGDDLESNLGKGIQNITEDTAQILASYLNAIRQDVSVNREFMSILVKEFGVNVVANIASCIAELKRIEANTLRSANGIDDLNDKLDSVMNGSKAFYTK